MGLLYGTRRALLGREQTYAERVLATGPALYLIQGEAAGATAVDQVNSPDQDGAYIGVTLGQPGIGDGNTAPLYDGANDLTNAFSATFQGIFSGDTFSVMVWYRVFNAAVWTDGNFRYLFQLTTDAANLCYVRKQNANNTLRCNFSRGGANDNFSVAGQTSTEWQSFIITANALTAELYFNGTNLDTLNVAANWAGNVAANTVGSAAVAPTLPWYGYEAHYAYWTRQLAPGEASSLGVL